MQQQFTIFMGILLGVTGILLGLNFEVSTSHATNETAPVMNNTTKFGNITTSEKNTALDNGTIILNVAEVGDEEQYRWVDVSGAENPVLNIMAGKDYTFKISNRTPEVHELIIDTKVDGKASEVAKSDEIQPYSKNVEFDFKSDKAGSLEYHCKYHPGMMNGTINVGE
jgi:plastocyanin